MPDIGTLQSHVEKSTKTAYISLMFPQLTEKKKKKQKHSILQAKVL